MAQQTEDETADEPRVSGQRFTPIEEMPPFPRTAVLDYSGVGQLGRMRRSTVGAGLRGEVHKRERDKRMQRRGGSRHRVLSAVRPVDSARWPWDVSAMWEESSRVGSRSLRLRSQRVDRA